MDRRDFLKRTGGVAAHAALPNVDKLGSVASKVSNVIKGGSGEGGFIPSVAFLAKYIQKVSDIPYFAYNNSSHFGLDCNNLMKFIGIKPEWKPNPDGINSMTLDPKDTFDKILQSTGDKDLVARMRNDLDRRVKAGEFPGHAVYNTVWKFLGAKVPQDVAQNALGQLINQKGYSVIKLREHAKELGNHSVEMLKNIIKREGGAANIFKIDQRKLRDTWSALPDIIKKHNNMNSIEDLENMMRNQTLSFVVDFPNAAEILNLPDWLVKSVKRNYDPDFRTINKDVQDYMRDYTKHGRTKADANLSKTFIPKSNTLGAWNKEGKKIGALGPGGDFGRYASESIHCFTSNYAMLIESI